MQNAQYPDTSRYIVSNSPQFAENVGKPASRDITSNRYGINVPKKAYVINYSFVSNTCTISRKTNNKIQLVFTEELT